MTELDVGGKQILEAMTGLQDVSTQVNQGSREMNSASENVTEAIATVSRITTEVSNSANEITIGITEVSGAMTLVTELSGNLGDITDRLEHEAALFKTESAEGESGSAEKLSRENTADAAASDDEIDAAEKGSESAWGENKEESMLISSGDVTGVTISDKEWDSVDIENVEEI